MSTSDNLQTSSDTVAIQYLLALVILNISIITTSPDIIFYKKININKSRATENISTSSKDDDKVHV